MSVLSPYAENVTGGAGKSPAEDLYYKWMVAAAVFLVALEISYLTLAGFPPIEGWWVGDTHFVIGRDSSIPGWAVVRRFSADSRAVTRCAPWSARPTRNVTGSYPPHLILRAMPRPPRLIAGDVALALAAADVAEVFFVFRARD